MAGGEARYIMWYTLGWLGGEQPVGGLLAAKKGVNLFF